MDLKSIVTADISQLERQYRRAEGDAQKTARAMDQAFKRSPNIRIDTSRAKADLRSLETMAGASANSVRKAFSGISAAGQGVFGGINSIIGGNLISGALSSVLGGVSSAMKDGLNAGLDYNKMIEKASISFKTLLGSTDAAQKHLKDLQTFAESTPFEFPDLIKASQRMQAMGFSARDVIPSLRSIGDAVGAVGGGREELNGVVMALGQMQTKGKVSAEEMNQLAERGIPAWDLLAKAIGRTKAETMKLSEQGRLSGERAVQGIVAMMGERFGGQMDAISKTLEGRESNFQDILNRQLGTATTGAFEKLKEGYTKATEGLATTGAQAFAGEINKLLTDIGNQMDPILQDLASGKLFVQGAQATQLIGDAGKAAGQAGGFLKKIAPPDHPLNQKYEIKDLNIFRPEEMKDPLDRMVFGGIKSALQALGVIGKEEGAKAGAAIGKGIETGAKDSLGIKSPSKVFEEIGLNTMQGFLDGLEAGKKLISKSPIDVEAMKKRLLEDLQKLRDDPRIKSMLDTIASAEGANYNTLFGGGTFKDFSQHPNQRITRKMGGKPITSTAAGRYQFLNRTWEGLVKELGLPDFSPESQDLGAIRLMQTRGMIGPIMNGDLPTALTKGNREWASLPGSPYGQPTKKAEVLIEQYSAALEKLTGVTMGAIEPLKAFVDGLSNIAKLPEAVMGKLSISNDAAKSAMNLMGPMKSGATIPMLPPAMKRLEVELSAMPPAISRATAATAAATSQAGQFADAIMATTSDLESSLTRLDNLKQGIGSGFDQAINALKSGSASLGETARSVLVGTMNEIFDAITSEILLKATGGKASTIGGVIGNAIGGLFKKRFDPSASGSAPAGDLGKFKTPDFNPNAGASGPLNQGIKEVAERVTDSSKTVADAVNTNGNKSVAELIKQTQLNAKMAACGCPDKVGPTKGPSLLGSILGAAIGALGAGFGGGGGGGGSGELTGVGFEEFAKGGSYGGGLALVGEQGPELINFNRGGWVYNARQTQQMMESQQTVVNVSNSFHITAPGGQISRETQSQIAARTAEAMNHAVKRNG